MDDNEKIIGALIELGQLLHEHLENITNELQGIHKALEAIAGK